MKTSTIICFFFIPIDCTISKKRSASPHHTEIVESEQLAKRIRKAEIAKDWDKVKELIELMNQLLLPTLKKDKPKDYSRAGNEQ